MNHYLHTGTTASYVTGFIASVALTLAAYALATHASFDTRTIIGGIVLLGITQLLAQMVFFLHVGRESRPRWNLLALLFALIICTIVVAGSLWIMQNLQANMQLDTADLNAYIQSQN